MLFDYLYGTFTLPYRLKDYPQYCQHLAAIPHFHQFPQHLIEVEQWQNTVFLYIISRADLPYMDFVIKLHKRYFKDKWIYLSIYEIMINVLICSM